jgi:cytochrome c-type biogenesis protein CcmH/NrfF
LVDQDSTDQEIRDVFVGRYGAAVLMTPDGDRGRWLFTLPVVFILTATVIAVLTLRRMLVRRPRLEPAGVGPEIEVDEKDLDW